MSAQLLTRFERITLEQQASVARLTLHHPPLNVIDIRMMDELASAIADIEAQREISAVVLSGAGKCFSAGVDVAAHVPDTVAEMLNKFHAVVRALISSSKITIAAVHGQCLGGGAELVMICDIIITTESADWGFPEISLGCYPPVACTALSALTGQKRAAALILTGRKFDGREALSYGLASSAVPEDQLDDKLSSLLRHLDQLSPAALALAKRAIYAWDSIHFDKGLARAEKIYLDELMKTEDAQEGIRAFLEKRPPKWKGR
jgi:cyclohexa-1,5-dienecarbonyl-CoA hydratase